MSECACCGQEVDFERCRILSCNLPEDGLHPEVGIHCHLCIECFRREFAKIKWWVRRPE